MNKEKPENIDTRIEQLGYHELTIFTSTLYKYDKNDSINNQNIIRSKLAIKTIKNAWKLWINLVVVDGWSCEDFLWKIREFKNITLIEANDKNNLKDLSMWAARRMALSVAKEKYNTEFYLWMEPEKDNLINKENINPLMQEAKKGEYSIIIPKRKDKKSLPDFQAREETRANKELSSLMNNTPRIWGKINKNDLYNWEEYDFFFWPKLFSKKALEYFLNYNSELDWSDAIIAPVLVAKENWLAIGSKEIDYRYDITQKENEEKSPIMSFTNNKNKVIRRKVIDKKRLEQYVYIIKETKKQLQMEKETKEKLLMILSDNKNNE